MGWLLRREQPAGAVDLARIDDDAGRLRERREGRLHERHVRGVGDVRDAGAEPPERPPQHSRTGRPVGLGHVGLHGEARDDHHAPRSAQRAGGSGGSTWRRERGDVTAAGVEGENLVDGTGGARHESGRYHRLASYSKHW
jgi:hypothetical protein